MSSSTSTGYGPSKTRWDHLHFNGDEREYDSWEIRMLAYFNLKGLKKTVLPASESDIGDFEVDAEKDETAFSELVQFLDKRSLGLISRDGKNSGRRSLAILRNHYAGTGKPRVMVLYTQLSTLEKSPTEELTDYVLRAEVIATSLKSAGESGVSDPLLIAMVLKGLPVEYKPFSVVVMQSEKNYTFHEFKVALRDFEENEKVFNNNGQEHNVMRSSTDRIVCYFCKNEGHKANACPSKPTYCKHCKTNSHKTEECRRKHKHNSNNKQQKRNGDKAKSADSFSSFNFMIDCDDECVF